MRLLIDAVRDGRLPVAQCSNLSGYASLLIRREDLARLLAVEFVDGNEAFPTTAEFGRRVGLRSGAGYARLVKAGHAAATMAMNPATGYIQLCVTEGDAVAFHSKFATATTLAAERDIHWRTVIAGLDAAGVQRFSPDGVDYGNLFLRAGLPQKFRAECLSAPAG